MKKGLKALLVAALTVTSAVAIAEPAKSEKQAKHALKMRKAVFSLIGSNMGPMGGMAKGKIPFNAQVIEKNSLRINQLSMMIADYMKTDTSGFDLKTDALPKIWKEDKKFTDKIAALTKASMSLNEVAKSGDEAAIKKAIGGVGKSCGSCHDDFKAD